MTTRKAEINTRYDYYKFYSFHFYYDKSNF